MRISSNHWPALSGPFVAALAGFLIGALSWSGHLIGLLLAPFLVLVWARSTSRTAAFLAAFCYYLGAGRGLLKGAGVFFADVGPVESLCYGLLLWLGYSGVLGLVWALLWGSRMRALRLLAILVIISVPPIGVVGGFSPLLAASAYFPGLKWISLLLCVIGLAVLAQSLKPGRAALTLAACAILTNLNYVEPLVPRWDVRDTTFGQTRGTDDEYDKMLELHRIVEEWSDRRTGEVLLLPELVGGDWPVNATWWHDVDVRLKQRNQTVLVGAYFPEGDGSVYDNVLVSLGAHAGRQFRDRVPVPISMWKPWSESGARTYWAAHEVRELNGKKVASLICYEQLLVWPALLSMLESPDLVLAPANGWWARDTNLPAAQHQSVRAWSRIFAIPSIWATNM